MPPASSSSAQPGRRSRIFTRVCPKRFSSGELPKVKFPDVPLILAGALGGPFVIFALTPLRNALTLASQDQESSAFELYGRTFQSGFAAGWTGGWACVIPSCPQFIMLGPLYHLINDTIGSAFIACFCSAMAETLISFGSQTLNSQLAFNAEQIATGGEPVKLSNPLIPFGPGVTIHVIRNIVNLTGIRVLSAPCNRALSKLVAVTGIRLSPRVLSMVSDFCAPMLASCMSASPHQLYNFAVTSPMYMESRSPSDKFMQLMSFLQDSYLLYGDDGRIIGLSPVLGRDLFMRCAYVGTLMLLFVCIENIAVLLWAKRKRAS
mmetsp:Transcript_35595/g.81569  ORF Transcript_35595/g.81569 Transcript_35595/m.81569 type:complete len:320 (-) Transcript_35595:113-1072(-)